MIQQSLTNASLVGSHDIVLLKAIAGNLVHHIGFPDSGEGDCGCYCWVDTAVAGTGDRHRAGQAV